MASPWGPLALAHNGNLINAPLLRAELEAGGVVFESTTDSEVIAQLIARAPAGTIEDAVAYAMERIDGAYPGDYAGNVVGAGDFSGDGFDEVAIMGRNERLRREEISVVFGRPDPPAVIDLRTLGSRGFRIRALEGHNFFSHVIAAGDYDGDGQDDLAVRLEGDPS